SLRKPNAQKTIFDFLAAPQFLDDAAHGRVDGQCEPAWGFATVERCQRGCQANKLSVQVNESAAAAPEIESSVGLDERGKLAQRFVAASLFLLVQQWRPAAQITHDPPGRARAAVTETSRERIGQRQHELPLTQFFTVAK